MTSMPSEPRPRAIGSIAHLFLSVRQNGNAALRKAPVSRYMKKPDVNISRGNTAVGRYLSSLTHSEESAVTSILSDPGNKAEILFCDNCMDVSRAVVSYLSIAGEKYGDVRYVRVNAHNAELVEFEPSREKVIASGTVIAKSDNLQAELLPALQELAYDCDRLLINVDYSYLEQNRRLLQDFPYITIICSTDNDDILSAYKTIKWLSLQIKSHKQISVYIYSDTENESIAQKAFDKLARTAKEFLGVKLFYKGRGVVYNEQTENSSTKITEQSESPNKEHNTDNKDALADLVEPEEPDGSVVSKAEISDGYIRQHPWVLSPVPVGDLPQTDSELADVLQLGLPGWLNTVPMAIVVPLKSSEYISSAMKVLVDATSRLWVMWAGLCADADTLTQAFNARRWLIANLDNIQNQCRQLRIDSELPVGVVIVSGDNIERLRRDSAGITDFPCEILQLCFIQSDTGNELVII